MSELAKQLRGETVTRLPLEDEPGEPPIGPIRFGAFSNPMFEVVLRKFGKTAFARSSACMEFESFVRRILPPGGGAMTCLEIGTYQGMSAVILSQFFDRVICVSVDDDPRRIIKRDIVDFLGIKNIEFHDVNNNAEKKRLVDSLSFDFAYSDGDHANDANEDFDLVHRCGRVLMHEAWPLQSSVWNLAHSLLADEVTWAMHDCFCYWSRADG